MPPTERTLDSVIENLRAMAAFDELDGRKGFSRWWLVVVQEWRESDAARVAEIAQIQAAHEQALTDAVRMARQEGYNTGYNQAKEDSDASDVARSLTGRD